MRTGDTARPGTITSVEIHRLSQPLTEPYSLAFGTFDAFDTFLCQVKTEDGRSAWGETTACTGYVPETGDEIWAFLRSQAAGLIGSTAAKQMSRLTPFTESEPFAVAPLLTALEKLDMGPAAPSAERAVIVPLVGILSVKNEKALEDSFWKRVEQGHRTVKLKVGFEVERDMQNAALVQTLARQSQGVRVRVDANQGYSLDDARRLAQALSPDAVELFEQPFEIGNWESQVALVPHCPVPMMLDESIRGPEDVRMAAHLGCASYVKFKLMKAGSQTRLLELIALSRQLGLRVVLGNGVAGEIGGYHEAVASLEAGVETAGEMNGFLKVRRSVMEKPLTFADGGIVVTAGYSPTPSPERVNELAVQSLRWG